jgi:hypothetical protein
MILNLNELYTDAASFTSIPNGSRVFFALTYLDPDIVSLGLWPTRGGSGNFDNDPLIVLQKGRSIIINENPIYFGNLELDPPEVKSIKDDIRQTGAAFVLFIPSTSSLYPHHMQYTINLSMDDPAVKSTPEIIKVLATLTANPSPPKSL